MTLPPHLSKLRELAMAATPGPWFVSGVRYRMNGAEWQNVGRYDEALKRDENIAAVGYDPRTHLGYADAQYIAACSPDALLRLLAEYERMRTALTDIAAQYENQYVNHLDFRLQAKFIADKALSSLSAEQEKIS